MKTRWHDFHQRCRYCHKEEVTKDHIIPLSRGGINGKRNFQPLCKKCNHTKGALTEKEIVEIFRDIKQRGIWYTWEKKYQEWLDYIEENRQSPLNWTD